MEAVKNRFERAGRIVLMIIAGALPLWFVPWPIGVEYGREVTFGILIILAAVFWFLSALTRGEVRYKHSIILWSAAGALLVFGLSAIFSRAPFVSAFIADPGAETLVTIVLGIVLMLLAGNILTSRDDVGTSLFVFIAATGLSGVLTLIQLFFDYSLWRMVASFASNSDFNVVGTMNGYMVFQAAVFMMAAGLLSSSAVSAWKAWMRMIVMATMVVLGVNLILVNFSTAWVALLVSGVIFFSLAFRDLRRNGLVVSKNPGMSGERKGFNMALGILVVSIMMLVVTIPPLKQLTIPAEVAPSFSSTVNVAKSVFKEGPKQLLLGSGPGTFGLLWNKYKDPAINQTIFWGVRFNQGSSWVSTVLATTGILGALALALFLVLSALIYLRAALTAGGDIDVLAMSSILGYAVLIAAAFLYPANFTLIIVLFLIAGWLSLLLARPDGREIVGVYGEGETAEGSYEYSAVEVTEGGPRESRFWAITARTLRFESSWAIFVSSLAIIFLLALGIAGLSYEVGRARAAFLQADAVTALNEGRVDEAVTQFERAAILENKNYRNYQALVQARIRKVQSLIQRAAGGENVQQEFQQAVSTAIQNSQTAIGLHPDEPLLWRTQGALYELIIPFIQGSERFAFDSYRRATELDPHNPAVWVDLGRAGLVFADRLQVIASQVSGQEREQVGALFNTVLSEIEQALRRSSEIKPDFAPAHFLMAQTAIRQGNLQSAIQATESAKLSAPFDIGVAFQLGLLYYQANDLSRAQAEFERAISLSPNYSNARYFLGLIFDRKNERARSVEQFERILELNPGNNEVERILVNLRAGRGALQNIVPPAAPPEARVEPPIAPKGSDEDRAGIEGN